MSRFLRYLRIAFSATCLIACVLLIVMWVRSYRWREDCYYRGPNQSLAAFISDDGNFFFTFGEVYPPRPLPTWIYSKSDSTSVRQKYTVFDLKKIGRSKGEKLRLRVPAWIMVFAMPIFAALPWLRWRFSLRSLLIATTLIAVVLGLIVWLSR